MTYKDNRWREIMKKILILFCFIIGCASLHTERKVTHFDIKNRDISWSRLHYYVHERMGFRIVDKNYHPYIIHIKDDERNCEVIIFREFDENRFKVTIYYTKPIEQEYDYTPFSEIGKQRTEMSAVIDNMIEYARTGKE